MLAIKVKDFTVTNDRFFVIVSVGEKRIVVELDTLDAKEIYDRVIAEYHFHRNKQTLIDKLNKDLERIENDFYWSADSE